MLRTAPPPAKVEGGHLGLAIPGEDALPVATDAHDAAGGREVREVPDLFADNGVEGVEDPLVHLEDLDLVLLAPRLSGGLVQARHGVGAVLGDDDRLVLASPVLHLLAPVTLGGGEVTGVDVPAEVTVEEKDVGVLRNPARPVRGEHDVDKAHRAGGVSVTGHVEEGTEVVFCRLGLGLGLVGDGPDDDAGVVLVTGDEVADDLGVNLLGLAVDGLLGEGGVALGAKMPPPKPMFMPTAGVSSMTSNP